MVRLPLRFSAKLFVVVTLSILATRAVGAEKHPTAPEVTKEATEKLPTLLLANPPSLPRESVDTVLYRTTGRQISVRRGESLQTAINQARRGDTIRVDPKGEWPAIVLPAKPGSGWIRIESMSMKGLPEEGERVLPTHAEFMPTIWNVTTETPRPALNTELRASHYRLIGLRFKSRKYVDSGHNKMLMLGRGNSTVLRAKDPEDLPHHIIIDRCILEGYPNYTSKGMYLDGRHIAVVGCQILDITSTMESQGILITDTPGPILIQNNAIGASGVNIFIGDNNPLRWVGVNAADITIRDNLLYKKAEWKDKNTLKNHFEMKRGERVLFENNECVYSPVDGQEGFSIKLKTGGHDQKVSDVTLKRNSIRDVNGYLAISNTDEDDSLHRILSWNNKISDLFEGGTAYQFLVEPNAEWIVDVAFVGDEIEGNAMNSLVKFGGRHPNVERFECRGIFSNHGDYGVKGDSTPTGTASLARFSREFLFEQNVLYGPQTGNSSRSYPQGNRHEGRRVLGRPSAAKGPTDGTPPSTSH